MSNKEVLRRILVDGYICGRHARAGVHAQWQAANYKWRGRQTDYITRTRGDYPGGGLGRKHVR